MKKSFFLILFISLFAVSMVQAASFTMPTSLSTDTTNYVLLSSSGTIPAISGFSTDVKIVVSVSTGTLKITTTTGLIAPTGYTGSPGEWDGASEISFEGTQTNVNNALATLSYQGGVSGSAKLEATATPTGPAYFKDNGHYYQFVNTQTTWTAANTAASASTFNGLTGYLVTITSSNEETFVNGKANPSDSFWAGASDVAIEGDWRWVTGPEGKTDNGAGLKFWSGTGEGTSVNDAYTNWNGADEPNNGGAGEHYLEREPTNGSWNDVPDNGYGYPKTRVIEYGDLNGESAIVFADTNLTIVSTQNPPTLLSSIPADDATSVALGANIILTFSEAVDVETGNILLKKTDHSIVETIDVMGALVTGTGTKTITINPTADLEQNTGYYILIDGTAFDDASSQSYSGISSTTVLNFSTSPNISYSATTFTEAGANDGSIPASITLTLSNDTYASDVVSANRVTAINVPPGLTASFVRTSNTIITVTLTGIATNHANTNSITNLTFTFADGAFTTSGTASDVTNYAKNDLKINFSQAGITYSANTYSEALANDGSTSSSITLTLTGDIYVGDVVTANRISVKNVPAGLTANFVRTSNTVITATLTGNASSHTNADDVSNMEFTFANGAFTTVSIASTVTNYAKNDLVVNFTDQASIAYSATSYVEAGANDGSITTSITLTLSGDTYHANVVSNPFISASNVPAGLTANFARTSATVITATLTGNAINHLNANDINNLTFTFADGAFTNTATASNVTNYAKNDLVVNFTDQASIAYSAISYVEAGANDGSITTSITLTLSGDSYHANVVSNPFITASNVPAGLSANFVRTSATVITATLTGNAINHLNANDINNLTFTFADGAFTNTATASNVTNYAKNDLVVNFSDPTPNVPPTLTTFADVVDFTSPDTEVEITLTELKAQGDEADADGTVDGFVIKAVTTGSLKIGIDVANAAAFDVATNNTVNAANKAYWTPASGSDETLNAFTAVALDNDSAESNTARQVQVFVTINNTVTPTPGSDDLSFSSSASLGGNPIVYSLIIIPTDDNPAPPPAPVSSLSGVVDIDSTSLANNGYSLVVTFNLPANSSNRFMGYWKYGPEAGGADHWYDYGTLVSHAGGAYNGTGYEITNSGKTLKIYITDGKRGDDDLAANGTIKDPGLPLLLDANGNPIPTLSFWGLMILSLIISVLGVNYRHKIE